MKRVGSLLIVLMACGGGGANGGASGPNGSAPQDAGAGIGESAPADAGRESAADGGSAADAMAPFPPVAFDAGVRDAAASCDAALCGSVSGVVQRTSTAPSHGGVGTVYVAVFSGDPITNQSSAVMVAKALLPDENMSAATAQVAYRVDGVPVSSSAYQVIAFLDDADAVSASSPAPASGDLVSLDTTGGMGGYPVTVSSATDVVQNLPLNFAMP